MKKEITIIFTLLATLPGTILNAQKNLSLPDAIGIALENNYEILITGEKENIARINNRWGAAGRYPALNLNVTSRNTRDNNKVSDFNENSITGGVNLDWTLFDGFSVNITKSKLEELERLSLGNSAVIIENTIEAVVLAYYRVLLEQERLEVFGEVMNLSKDRYDYEKEKRDIGSSVSFQVLQAQNSYLEDKAEFISQQVTLKNSFRGLNFLMAVKEPALWNMTDSFKPELREFILSELTDKMLSNNNTLKNQFINQNLLTREAALAKSKYYPKLLASAGVQGSLYNKDYDRGQSAPDIDTESWNYFGNITLSWNLYSGGNRNRAVKIAKINEDIGNTNIELQKHTLTNSLANLLEFYEVRKELLEVANEAVGASKLNMQIAEDKFKNGSINSFNYRDIQLTYLNAALGRLQAIYNLIESNIALSRITGGIITEYE